MTTIFDNPMISTSVRVWKNMGYIYQKDNRKFVTLVPNCIVIFGMIAYLLFSGETVVQLTLNLFFMIILLNSTVRCSIFGRVEQERVTVFLFLPVPYLVHYGAQKRF